LDPYPTVQVGQILECHIPPNRHLSRIPDKARATAAVQTVPKESSLRLRVAGHRTDGHRRLIMAPPLAGLLFPASLSAAATQAASDLRGLATTGAAVGQLQRQVQAPLPP
jgi:hypothetical protein